MLKKFIAFEMYRVFSKEFYIICDVLGVSKKIDIIWDV